MSIADRSQALIPGEKVLSAGSGQTGVYPLLWWLPYGEFLTMFNGGRVIAVTDKSFTVLKSGRTRWSRNRPTKVICSVPRSTPFGPFNKRWERVELGGERIWLHRKVYRVLERAAGTQPAATTSPATSTT